MCSCNIRCSYCDLKVCCRNHTTSITNNITRFFCDESCCFAFFREQYSKGIDEHVADLIYEREQDGLPTNIKKFINLQILFYSGLLKRQSKSQLTLLLDCIKKQLQILFTEEEEDENPSGKNLYVLGKMLTPANIAIDKQYIDFFSR